MLIKLDPIGSNLIKLDQKYQGWPQCALAAAAAAAATVCLLVSEAATAVRCTASSAWLPNGRAHYANGGRKVETEQLMLVQYS